MQHVRAPQLRWSRHHVSHVVRRGFVLVLALVFALSGFAHVTGNDYGAHATLHADGLVSIGHDSGGKLDCSKHDGQMNDAKECGVTSGCVLCGLVGSLAVFVPPEGGHVGILSDPVHPDRAPPLHLRPPKLIPNV